MTARVGHRGRGVAPKSTVVSRERTFIGVDVRAYARTDGRTDGRTARSGEKQHGGAPEKAVEFDKPDSLRFRERRRGWPGGRPGGTAVGRG